MKHFSLSLTEGPIGKQLLSFTIPLILGNLFQQLYNAADTVIVGQFVGDTALAAVGSSSSLIELLISLFMGIGIGAGVIISRYYGAGDMDAMSCTIHTTVAAGVASGVVLSLLGVLTTPLLLQWMGTPDNVLPQSILYFRIYFCGVLFTVLYNFGSSIFRALGDSKRPLYYLIFSSFTNVVLDLLFVAVFRWGVAGAATATVLSNALSVVLVFYKLCTEDGPQRLYLRRLRLDKPYLLQVIRIGLPSGLQNAVVSLSTFISQNMGAGKKDRAKRGANIGLLMTMGIVVVISIFIFVLAPLLVEIFTDDPVVMDYGVAMARTIVPFYFLVAYSHGMGGILRGAGLAKVPMFVMMFCWCVFRVIWIQVAGALIHDIHVVFVAYPITWALSGVIFTIYYFKSNWLNRQHL